MEFHAELFHRSLVQFGKVKDFVMTLNVPVGESITNPYLIKNCVVEPYENIDEVTPTWFGGLSRWRVTPRSDVVVFHDCDVLCCNDPQPLIDLCRKTGSVCGVIANEPPFLDSYNMWKRVFSAFSLELPDVMYIHNHHKNKPEPKVCPPYFNYGVIAVPSHAFAPINNVIGKVFKTIKEMLSDNWFSGQIALSVALALCKIPHTAVEMKYNYHDIEKTIPDNVVFFHCTESKLELKVKNDVFKLSNSTSPGKRYAGQIASKLFSIPMI
jgi:hypothetical protein